MKTIDINKKRKARAAQREKDEDEPVVILIGDEKIKLPPEAPAEFAFKLAEGNVRGALIVMMNGQSEAFFAQNPSTNDINDVVEGIAEAYGFDDLGESVASESSS